MDTSKEYMKMCDCPEVQEGWIPEDYDPYAILTATYKTGFDCRIAYGVSSLRPEKRIEYLTPSYFDENTRIIRTPRQDQIQEWLYEHSGNTDCYILFERFFGWVWTDDTLLNQKQTKLMGSLEQLWLAFYIHEAHGLTWAGEKWE